MANHFQKPLAEKLLRSVALDERAADPIWVAKIQKLSELVEYRVSMTCVAMLGTALLAKALHQPVNLFWFKPTHVSSKNKPNSYSARTLCHGVLVPMAAEHNFSLGVTGREPLNNQPFFRMKSLDDGTPVNNKAKEAFNYMMKLIREAQMLPDREAALNALHAFVFVRRQHVPHYSDAKAISASNWAHIIEAITQLVKKSSGGGSHAQAIAAGLIDISFGRLRTESGRINDPSRNYPGDVCVRSKDDSKTIVKSIEVRDKPVSVSDIRIFARRCQAEKLTQCGVLMVSARQQKIVTQDLVKWADELGLTLKLWFGWEEFVRESVFWMDATTNSAPNKAAISIRERLIDAEVSAETIDHWDTLTTVG